MGTPDELIICTVPHASWQLDMTVVELKKEVDARRSETEHQKRRKEREEQRLKELKSVLEKRQVHRARVSLTGPLSCLCLLLMLAVFRSISHCISTTGGSEAEADARCARHRPIVEARNGVARAKAKYGQRAQRG